MRFFSPPEKPTLRARLSISLLISSFSAAAFTLRMKSGVESSPSPRARRWALSVALRKVMVPTPGISSGYWKARNTPEAARSSGLNLEDVHAVEQDLAVEDLIILLAGDDVGQRRLAGAVGAHDGGDFAVLNGEVETVEDLLVLDGDGQVLDFDHCSKVRSKT